MYAKQQRQGSGERVKTAGGARKNTRRLAIAKRRIPGAIRKQQQSKGMSNRKQDAKHFRPFAGTAAEPREQDVLVKTKWSGRCAEVNFSLVFFRILLSFFFLYLFLCFARQVFTTLLLENNITIIIIAFLFELAEVVANEIFAISADNCSVYSYVGV